jgi:transcriptional regulator with XRE-family HTH domain
VTERPPAIRFYEAVTRALAKQGLNKAQLHQRSGIARSTVDNWRTGAKVPHAASVIAVADALGIDREEALRMAGHDVPTGHAPEREGLIDLSEVDTDVLMAEIRRRIPD